MAFTGDLEHLNIVDIIQLLNATRQSGVFSVKGTKAVSRIVFRKGHIVGANHIDNRVRIGSVLVKTGAITIDDLQEVLRAMKTTDANRMPLLATLVQTGKLKREDALRGLKKLVEMTIVELMGWPKGTFMFDTDAVVVAPEGAQDLEVDAQMVLMDALRMFDERERDRSEGKDVPSLEALYSDVIPAEIIEEEKSDTSTITADDLGLSDLDRLEKRIPRAVTDVEVFDPVEIHRRKIKELLPGFSPAEQDAFFSFLRKSLANKAGPDSAKQAGKAIILFSDDTLIRHSVMSFCNDEGVLVFSTDDAQELDRIVSQCLLSARMPVVVFDNPATGGDGFSRKKVGDVRTQVREKFSSVPVVQFASAGDNDFILQSYQQGVQAVLPKPSREDRRETYVRDIIAFLEAFRTYIKSLQYGQDDADIFGRKLREGITSLRGITNPSDTTLVVLAAVSEPFERAVTLLVRQGDLTGERAIGLTSDKSMGPTPADRLKIPLAKPSVFRDAVEKARVYYGESGDETLRQFFTDIGKPLSPVILLLPIVCNSKVVAMIYGDFGKKEPAPVRTDMLEILAQQAGIVLEYLVFRRQAAKAAQKT
ncbi:MAG TPA: response regulator [Nitrospirota bacterium]|nr:response regulator [Nitrospirota bacterium]